eukprot:892289-Rhodomonas_salina.1
MQYCPKSVVKQVGQQPRPEPCPCGRAACTVGPVGQSSSHYQHVIHRKRMARLKLRASIIAGDGDCQFSSLANAPADFEH